MRSRDGNHSFTLSISTIIFLLLNSSALLFADEYLISYQSSIKDATLYNETLLISKAMQKCQGEAIDENLILKRNKTKDLKKILLANRERFDTFLEKIGLYVDHREETRNSVNHSFTSLTLKTTCFKVDFNDNFVKITPLEQPNR